MNMSTDLTPYLRYWWGQTKKRLGIIKLKPWKDEPIPSTDTYGILNPIMYETISFDTDIEESYRD